MRKIQLTKKTGYCRRSKGQVTLEFTFCFIILLLLIYGIIMAFRWAGVSLIERRINHEQVLENTGWDEAWVEYDESPIGQVKRNFSKPTPMEMVFNKW